MEKAERTCSSVSVCSIHIPECQGSEIQKHLSLPLNNFEIKKRKWVISWTVIQQIISWVAFMSMSPVVFLVLCGLNWTSRYSLSQISTVRIIIFLANHPGRIFSGSSQHIKSDLSWKTHCLLGRACWAEEDLNLQLCDLLWLLPEASYLTCLVSTFSFIS